MWWVWKYKFFALQWFLEFEAENSVGKLFLPKVLSGVSWNYRVYFFFEWDAHWGYKYMILMESVVASRNNVKRTRWSSCQTWGVIYFQGQTVTSDYQKRNHGLPQAVRRSGLAIPLLYPTCLARLSPRLGISLAPFKPQSPSLVLLAVTWHRSVTPPLVRSRPVWRLRLVSARSSEAMDKTWWNKACHQLHKLTEPKSHVHRIFSITRTEQNFVKILPIEWWLFCK